MPGGDRTGPAGLGPMTGRAAGYCAGYPAPGFTSSRTLDNIKERIAELEPQQKNRQ